MDDVKFNTYGDLLNSIGDVGTFKRSDFEVGVVGNKEFHLNTYIVYLSQPKYIMLKKYTGREASDFEFKDTMIATALYGNPDMTWAIGYLNDDIEHASDLNYEMLRTIGIVYWNDTGLEALEDIKRYIGTTEGANMAGPVPNSLWRGGDLTNG